MNLWDDEDIRVRTYVLFFFFFNDTATTEIYTLSLHDALPIYIVYQLLALATTAVVFLGDAGAVAMLCTTLRLVQTEASPSE